MPLNALLLTDGVLSHTHQSSGLLRIMSASVALSIQHFSVQMHSNWMRGYLRKALATASDESLSWAAHCFNWSDLEYRAPELIVSAGTETLLVNAVLARRYRSDNVFIGGQSGIRAEWFNAVLTLDQPILSNAIPMVLPPSRLTPDIVDSACTAYRAQDTRRKGDCWAMILGGNGGGCHYSDREWHALIDGMEYLAKTHNIKWLVVITRLTSEHVQQRLRQVLNASHLESVITYGSGLDDPLLLLAARAKRIYCGAENLPILFDCIASGTPTLAILPERGKVNGQAQHLINQLRRDRLVSVLNIEELPFGRIVRTKSPLPDVLSRKYEELFHQLCSYCPKLIAGVPRY